MKIRLVTCFSLVVIASNVFAQTAARPVRKLQVPINRTKVVSGAAVPTKPPVPGMPVTTPVVPINEKLTKFKALRFNRTPSAILKAWAVPRLEEKKDETEIDKELRQFQLHVTMGNWEAVKAYLAELPEADAKESYKHLLTSLRSGPPPTPGISSQGRAHVEKNDFETADVILLADAAPHELEKDLILILGGILRRALDSGDIIEHTILRLRTEAARPDDKAVLTTREVVHLLFAAGLPVEAGEFLPDILDAKKKDDREALNLLSRYYLALHAKEKKIEQLEKAWEVTQAALASGEVDEKEKAEALKRAVELAPKIRDEFGATWLEESFTKRPERGMEIIATVGALASKGLQSNPTNADFRLKGLQLQKTAVEALLNAAPELGKKWQESLNLLASNWLREAQFSYKYDTSTSIGPQMQRDAFGNLFYMNYSRFSSSRTSNRAKTIPIGDLLEIQPGEAWLALIFESLKPKFDVVCSQLYLKVNEEAKAFPYIEKLSTTHRDKAKQLAEEFLRVWTTNHNPNQRRNRTNPYMYMYGYERKAAGIPLTRSKQKRNLEDLAKWVKRLRGLPIGDLDEALLAKAFTNSHSTAEVYRLEAIENVFGSIDSLKPKTLAEMVQKMRSNLIGVWRKPATQKDKQTNRKQKDIESEVMRGYAVSKSVIEGGLERYANDWSLQLAKAAIIHDENSYQQEIDKNSKFTKNREVAFAEFQRAATNYSSLVGELSEDEESIKVFEMWFYASLGACDLGAINAEKQPDLKQPKLIREAILALPGESAERHMGKFANSLFTRMSAVSPAVKFRYLRSGFAIVGNHKHAYEARKVYDYYNDLVTEIMLEAVIDGSDTVGQEPFGIFVNLRHTREIERESGGFSRYLQNQNNGRYYYNYGRPTENYREKFQETVEEALQEHFDVLSVTFQTEDVHSKAVEEYGWRVTPYAYVLLKARGPEVDTIPSLRLDLDFIDTSGYAIIPIETPPVPVDCSAEIGDDRPIQKLTITQTLDERQAYEGKLILEVKATGLGLVPSIKQLIDLAPEGFDIVETEDEGVSVSRFDPESEETVVVSERTAMITMQAKEGLKELPDSFRFGAAKLGTDEMTFQRYVDADLLAVEKEISLEAQYGKVSRLWLWVLIGCAVVILPVVLYLISRPRQIAQRSKSSFELPDSLTPFTVIGLLKLIHHNNGLNEPAQLELVQSIDRLERYFFVNPDGTEPDLRSIAEHWLQKTSPRA